MTGPERRRRVEELCDAALDRDARERAAFLTAACGDDASLRREVEALLAHAQTAEGFLTTPLGDVAANVLGDEPDASLVGRQIGSYKILSFLGAGGMGEVYRARDTKLGRDVAIKVVADAFLSDPDRLARFEREARVLATLNHPHIGAIYGLEEADPSAGSGQAAVRALVLELVEGDTLAERLAVGPLPIQEALTVARQIADALEAAHEKGIVHRDFKPGNIKITPDGVVKVLDFGLAKAAAGDGSSTDLSQSPMVTGGGTREGIILGTAAYMSPEQARGLKVDKRIDIWAFGCVLYEMLTGRLVFAGDTISDTIAKILERDPDWTALPGMTPLAVKRLLQRCLDKDPKRRLHDIADARIEIEDAISGTSLTATETAVVDPQRRPVRLPWSLAAIASLVALVAVGALMWYVRTAPQSQTAPPRLSRLTMATSGAVAVSVGGTEHHLAITPDGTRVIYIGNNNMQLFVRPLDQLASTAVFTSTAPLNWVFVSPDGQWVGFVEGALLKKMALSGGPAVIVPGMAFGGATWAPDDTIIFSNEDPTIGLQRVSAAGGDVTALTRPAPARGERDHLWPDMLPGGRAVLFTITATTGGLDAAQVAVLDLTTHAFKVLVRGGSHAHYVSSGHLVYAAGGTLRAIPFDLTRLETSGTPVTVLPRPVAPQGAGDFVVAADGTLAYVDAPGGTAAAARTLVWVDRQGREEPLAAPQRSYSQPRVSPDGTRVAVVVNDQENMDIWVWDLARQTLSRLTFDPTNDQFPAWTPDGRRVVFISGPSPPGLFWQPADGTGAAEALVTAEQSGVTSSVTPDGARVIFSPGGRDLMMLALDGTRPSTSSGQAPSPGSGRAQPLVQTPFNERNGIVSLDGRWLAYESDSSGRFEIYVRPFPNVHAGQWLISTSGGTRPLWAPHGQELFYVAPDGALMAVRVDSRGGAWSASRPAKVVEGPYLTGGGNSGRTYDVSTDGQRFLMIKQPANQAAAPQIVIVQHWVEELKRLVPTN